MTILFQYLIRNVLITKKFNKYCRFLNNEKKKYFFHEVIKLKKIED